MIDRRTILAGGAALLGLGLPGASRSAVRGAVRPLAMTDITVRRALAADFAGTLAALRAIGYTHFGTRLRRYARAEAPELPAAEKLRILRGTGMKIGAVRLSQAPPDATPDESIEAQLADAALLGARVVVAPIAHIFLAATAGGGFARHSPTASEVSAFVAELDALGRRVAAGGMKLAYHNHDFDAARIEGVRALDRFIDESDPRYVNFELDLAWAHIAGYDPLALAARLGPRMVSVHLKDVVASRDRASATKLVAPGDGEMDYAALLPRLGAMTRALLAVEVDAPADGMATAARAYSFVESHLAARPA